MTKVLLINPPWEKEGDFGIRSNSRWPHTRKDKALPFPIYLAYAAAVLEKEGIDVKVIDCVADEINHQEFKKLLTKEKPDYCFIETGTPSIKQDLKAFNNSLSKGINTFLLGPHATHFRNEILKNTKTKAIAGIIRGEFEFTIKEIIQNQKNLKKVNGITYKKGKKIIENPNRELINDLNELPLPARHLFDMKKYDSHLYHSPSFLIISSRGCPYQCNFCVWPDLMYGHKVRNRSIEYIINEIKHLKEKYGAKEIMFDDDTFTINKERIIKISKELKKLNIYWNCFGRVDRVDKETLKIMKDSGCEMIRFGVESGNNIILKRMKKNINTQQIKKAFDLCNEVGIKAFGTFMLGFPGENKRKMQKTIRFAKSLNAYAVQFSIVTPYPGTRLFKEADEKGWLINKDWTYYDGGRTVVMVPPTLTKEEIENAFYDAWKTFYLNPKYVLKILFSIRNFSDLKRVYHSAISFFKRFASFS